MIGVTAAEWNVVRKLLQVQFDPKKTNSYDIQLAVAKSGHDTEKFKATEGVYKTLPECCLYRK